MVLADISSNLVAARIQMALSLGWHIPIASLGVGFPLIILLAEWRGYKTGNPVYTQLARKWAKVAGVLFAIGAVSGTIISFEMGLLWPGLMQQFGAVFGLPFALEGIAFFLEAIFIGMYLYGWDRLTPKQHLLTGLPIPIAGVSSAFFVVCANAWMNQPQGFVLSHGKLENPDPLSAMFNPATPIETVHMILAAFMVSGFLVSSVYAYGWLKGKRNQAARIGFILPFAMAAICTPAQIIVGDMAARYVADHQPAKLAAMEGMQNTQTGAAEHVGGIFINGHLQGDVEIPHALSLLANGNPNSTIPGLDAVAPDLRPNVNVVHIAFDLMVTIGMALLALSVWFGARLFSKKLPTSPWFWRACTIAGVASVVALECGWIVTEVGRQPWIVYGVMKVSDAVNPAPGLYLGLYALIAVYTILTVTTLYILRHMSTSDKANQ